MTYFQIYIDEERIQEHFSSVRKAKVMSIQRLITNCGNNNDFRIARHQVSIVEVGKVKYTLGFDNRNKTVFVATGNIEEIISFIADNI